MSESDRKKKYRRKEGEENKLFTMMLIKRKNRKNRCIV